MFALWLFLLPIHNMYYLCLAISMHRQIVFYIELKFLKFLGEQHYVRVMLSTNYYSIAKLNTKNMKHLCI